MGKLRRISDGLELELGSRVLLGRSTAADIRLLDAASSAEHAALYHDGDFWYVKDLSSLNGTQLNDALLTPRVGTILPLYGRLRFGGNNEQWEVTDVTPPAEVSAAETLLETVFLNEVQLHFDVDEPQTGSPQSLRLSMLRAGADRPVASRAYHSLLLFLAFARSSDAEHENGGWISSEALVPNPYPDLETLNVNIFRARKQFKGLGIKDGQKLIERKSGTRLIRLGTEKYQLSQAAFSYCERLNLESSW